MVNPILPIGRGKLIVLISTIKSFLDIPVIAKNLIIFYNIYWKKYTCKIVHPRYPLVPWKRRKRRHV